VTVSTIDEPAALAALCERIDGVDEVSLDTEFHNERSYAARLMVVQLVVGDEVALVDPLRLPDLMPLARALEAKTVIGHALSSDLKIFADRFDALPAAAFDTQLAAAFCGFGMSISLADLIANVAGVRLRKSQTVSDWSARPLSAQQIDYLVDDVRYLPTLRERLAARLAETGRTAWFEADARPLVDLAKYRPDPERLYLRVPGAMRMNRRELGLMRELARLRDRLARERDVPLKFIIPDDVMAPIVSLRPATRDDLGVLRRLDAGARKAYGDRIVEAIAAGVAIPDDDLPRKPPRPPSLDRDAIVALLAVLCNGIATEHQLPAGLLVTRASLERVARDLPDTADGIALSLEVDDWRAALVAEPLRSLLRGEVALGIAGAARHAPRIARLPASPASELGPGELADAPVGAADGDEFVP